MNRVGVMHVIDSLLVGGAERVAVNLVNELPAERFRPSLCTTRQDGAMETAVAGRVRRLRLRRGSRLETPGAVRRLVSFIRENNVRILHAHGTAVMMARMAACYSPYPRVLWHLHAGRLASRSRGLLPYRLAATLVHGVICVNDELVEWVKKIARLPANRVWNLPNMVCAPPAGAEAPELPGAAGKRILCVANIRPEKDHKNLIEAFGVVRKRYPEARLFLAGEIRSGDYYKELVELVAALRLQDSVKFLGLRGDIGTIMQQCDIGVLSSRCEGLPMALLELGWAGLPVIATDVGQCSKVLEDGHAGMIVPPASPLPLAESICALLESPARRSMYAGRLKQRLERDFSPQAVTTNLSRIYDAILSRN